jgi:hypothetical protein
MQVSSGQDGIQRLLAAEAEAQLVVAKARKGKRLFFDCGIRSTLICVFGAREGPQILSSDAIPELNRSSSTWARC